jgi:hypothetical protein
MTQNYRATAVRQELEQAEQRVSELKAQIFSLVLEKSEGKPGAISALEACRLKLDAAARDVEELRGAVALAERLDREPESAAATAKVRQMSEFAGMTTDKCPRACTAERCIISSVAVCKHPCKSPMSGCGPVTVENRKTALAYLSTKVDAA